MTTARNSTTSVKTADTSKLVACLKHNFANPELLNAALTHPSLTGSKNHKKGDASPYERLEFLGDRVLGLVIADWLYALFPGSREGDLAKRHASLVNRDALRAIALEIGLERYLRLAHGEEVASSGRKNLATLSDALEAVIGAIFLDGGLEPAKNFIQHYWKNEATKAEATPVDPKTALQEWAQGHGLPLPSYKTLENSGPAHAPKFVIEVTVKGHLPAIAEGPSKRAAEKSAAEAILKHLSKPTKS
ncbi:MAG: ribonuclease III [Alphaproteobacteria bacterium]|nr:ribonuclease III [Alphaproteobacteria bacterium]